jgi:hypothetical protein
MSLTDAEKWRHCEITRGASKRTSACIHGKPVKPLPDGTQFYEVICRGPVGPYMMYVRVVNLTEGQLTELWRCDGERCHFVDSSVERVLVDTASPKRAYESEHDGSNTPTGKRVIFGSP